MHTNNKSTLRRLCLYGCTYICMYITNAAMIVREKEAVSLRVGRHGGVRRGKEKGKVMYFYFN